MALTLQSYANGSFMQGAVPNENTASLVSTSDCIFRDGIYLHSAICSATWVNAMQLDVFDKNILQGLSHESGMNRMNPAKNIATDITSESRDHDYGTITSLGQCPLLLLLHRQHNNHRYRSLG